MAHSVQAVFEGGVLRLLEPLALEEHQQVTVTVSDPSDDSWLDPAFLSYLATQADDQIDLAQIRTALAKIPGTMSDDFRSERDERS